MAVDYYIARCRATGRLKVRNQEVDGSNLCRGGDITKTPQESSTWINIYVTLKAGSLGDGRGFA